MNKFSSMVGTVDRGKVSSPGVLKRIDYPQFGCTNIHWNYLYRDRQDTCSQRAGYKQKSSSTRYDYSCLRSNSQSTSQLTNIHYYFLLCIFHQMLSSRVGIYVDKLLQCQCACLETQ
ncbi:hypothetical protein FGO68_gene301 [Halteria grandinella]|uniref:Uncharacterized protein n=1 Tax=Halteria grandinella TaxID=5974 RepID=A0A8J8NP94_HALGN|nr:hypothetical protein FGO68_gene301 [Halteria grandinella]